MRSYLKVTQIEKHGNRIEVYFDTDKMSKRYFESSEYPFWAEYSVSIDNLPDSIAAIPFLANILPIIWLADMRLEIDEIDKDFYDCLQLVRHGYEAMYPMLSFKGEVSVGKIVGHRRENNIQQSAIFFSGGLDAFATLFNHIDERPDLISVQGADISVYDAASWSTVLKQNQKVADDYGLSLLTIRSNFTKFIDINGTLSELISGSGENWWHGIQHGIAIISLAAPLAYKLGLSCVYIASSHTAADKVTCASDPTIDNYVRYCGSKIIHDGYEYDRFDKTRNVLSFVSRNNTKPFLRVCYQAGNEGRNCCECEKCVRTAAAIHILGGRMQDFGFGNPDILKHSYLKVVTKVTPTAAPLWDKMRVAIQSDINNPRFKQLRWLGNTNVSAEIRKLKIRALKLICRRVPLCQMILDRYLYGRK